MSGRKQIIPLKFYGWFGRHVPSKLSFPFYKERLLFSAPLNVYQRDVWFVPNIPFRSLWKGWNKQSHDRSFAPSVRRSLGCEIICSLA